MVTPDLKCQPKLVHCGGANLSKSKVTFTANSKYICCCCEKLIKVISVASGECVRELVGHRGEVTCVQTNPHNVLQVYTSSRDATIKQWDYEDGVMLKSFNVKNAIHVFYPLASTNATLVTLSDKKVTKVDLRLGKAKREIIFDDVIDNNRALSVASGNSLVAAITPNSLVCHSLATGDRKCHSLKKSRRAYFTCVQCHPTDSCVATGSSTGKIHIWRDVLLDDVVMTIHHWHHFAVNDLQFSAEGSYLLSGGEECVLVKWHQGSEEHDFLPRLEAPIRYISASPDNTLYAVVHADNAIQLVSSNLEMLHQYQGLTRVYLPQQTQDPVPTGLLVDPKTASLVLSGRPGHIQFYDIRNDRLLYNLDITCENYIPATQLGGPESCTDVTRAAFNHDGDLLATVEMWHDGVMSPEIRLKFWHDDGEGSFTLNTCVELPHHKAVNSMEFRPPRTSSSDSDLPSATLVTTSDDTKFKFWCLVNDTDIHRVNTKWECDSVGFYRDTPATECSFSQDGSLLAVVFGPGITLWDPDTNALKTSLSHSSQHPIKCLKFGRNASCHHLIASSATCLTVWNVLTCSAVWTVSLDASLLVTDPLSDLVAAVTTSQTLHIFRPSNPVPVYTHNTVGDIVAAVFVPTSSADELDEELPWQHKSRLYLMTRNQDLLTLSSKDESFHTAQHLGVSGENIPMAPMSLFVGKDRRSGVVTPMDDIPATVTDPAEIDDFFSAASHVLPPMSQLCGRFIERLLEPVARKKADKDETDENEISRSPEPHSGSDDSDALEILENEADADSPKNEYISDQKHVRKEQRISEKELETIKRIKDRNYDWVFNYLDHT